MNENTTTSFFFENGEIFYDDFNCRSLQDSSCIYQIVKIFRPVIEQNKLSGKIQLTILSNLARITYLNIKPFETLTTFMELIRAAD